MMADAPLIVTRSGAVATIVLNRPTAGNAFDIPLSEAILDAALQVSADPAVRAVVLTGAGTMFCTGGDVKAFGDAGPETPALIAKLTAGLHTAIVRLLRMEKPLIVAVNGAAAGAGLGLSLIGDVVIAARSAMFAAAYDRLGLTPDGGATWLLPRLVGLRQAQQILIGGFRVDADEALRIGLVTSVADDGALMDEAQAAAVKLAGGAMSAIRRTRALLLSSHSAGLESQLEREAEWIARSAGEGDGQEGIAAFMSKRRPQFGGRE